MLELAVFGGVCAQLGGCWLRRLANSSADFLAFFHIWASDFATLAPCLRFLLPSRSLHRLTSSTTTASFCSGVATFVTTPQISFLALLRELRN